MHVQNHTYASKSRCVYICDLLQLSNPEEKQKLEAALAFRLLYFSIKFPRHIHVHNVFYLAFLTGPQNSKSLKYWTNGEPGFMTGLFYSTKQFVKT